MLLLMIPALSISQGKLTKSEIYSMVCYEENRNKIEVNFDSSVVVIADSLKNLRIDTVGIFSWTLHGGFLESSMKYCEQSLWTAYVHWVKNGLAYHQKINSKCTFEPKLLSNSELIDFYIDNKIAINENRIMPVITNVTLNEKGKYIITSVMTNRNTIFNIYCELHGNSVLKTFDNDYLENKENIFYEENNSSIIKRWWELTENQINELEKK